MLNQGHVVLAPQYTCYTWQPHIQVATNTKRSLTFVSKKVPVIEFEEGGNSWPCLMFISNKYHVCHVHPLY